MNEDLPPGTIWHEGVPIVPVEPRMVTQPCSRRLLEEGGLDDSADYIEVIHGEGHVPPNQGTAPRRADFSGSHDEMAYLDSQPLPGEDAGEE